MPDEQVQVEKPALKRLEQFVMDLADYAFSTDNDELKRMAVTLSTIHGDFEDGYVYVDTEGQVPTVAQGIALARFLRPDFNGSSGSAGAFVSRGGGGLGSNYLHVRLNGGYEGGISRDGSIST